MNISLDCAILTSQCTCMLSWAQVDFAINIPIIGYHSVYALRIFRTCWHRCTTSIQCVVSFSPRNCRKKKRVQTECLQSVHLYFLSRSGELHSDVRLPRPASRQQQFSKVRIVLIVLTFIHISFLYMCWKQIELRSSRVFFHSHRSIGLPYKRAK